MDKIIKGKLALPPYLTPDARDLVKKVGSLSLLPLVWPPPHRFSQALHGFLSLPRPWGSRAIPACALGLWDAGALALGSKMLSLGLSSDADQLLTLDRSLFQVLISKMFRMSSLLSHQRGNQRG